MINLDVQSMNKQKSYINTLYLAVHLALNILVVALVINLIDMYVPLKHFFTGYHINLHSIYPPNTLEKNLAAAAAIGAAVWYYQKRKAKHSDTHYRYHLPNLRELEEFFKSKF
jgi:hypothetical protein